MTEVRVAFVDAYVLRVGARGGGVEVLALRRAPGGRSPGSWETVHGHIEAGGTPVQAGPREVREETGLDPARLYNLSRGGAFYRPRTGDLTPIPVFAGPGGAAAEPRASPRPGRAAGRSARRRAHGRLGSLGAPGRF